MRFRLSAWISFLRWFWRNDAFLFLPDFGRWIVPFTINTKILVISTARERHGGVSLAPMTPGIALKTCRCAVRFTPASSGGPGGTRRPVSTRPLAAVLAASPGCAPAFSPGFLDAPNPPAVSPQLTCNFPDTESHKKAGYIFQLSDRIWSASK